MAALSLRQVSRIHAGARRTVNRVSAEIADGEFVVIVGPSGCGKSTLLRMIAGLDEVSEGEIALDGRRVNDVAARDRDVAMVFQNYALYPHMTVRDNMAFGLRMRGFAAGEIERRVSEAADVLALTPLLGRRPQALSGGQRQRVAVGRAIVRHPKLFLFDEPLSNLDAKLRVSMRAELIRLHKRLGATMLYVTHDQVEAMSMADRLIVLKDGEVQQIGRPLDVYREPASRFVAGFIGSPPMNFLEADLDTTGEGALRPGNLVWPVPAHAREALRRAALPRVVVGVRPEHFHERALDPDIASRAGLTVDVDYLEPLGSEVHAACRLGDREIVVRLPSTTRARADAPLQLGVELEHARFFDPETGACVA